LRAAAAFCAERDLVLISDEIWRDIVFAPATFTPMALAAPEIADRLVTFSAPSKTFNLAGGTTSECVIADATLRARYARVARGVNAGEHNWFGAHLAVAAYREGAPWLDALIPCIEGNLAHFAAAISEIIPGARAMSPESTYLSWVDFSAVDLSAEERSRRIGEDARIGVSAGHTFGFGGDGWERFNLACPRATVDLALERLAGAFADLR
jgi:cystathionine beta-lyase